MLSSEERSTWRMEGELGVDDWRVEMAASPLGMERLPIISS